MPAGDRTGPRGRGPRSGRGMGYCSGYAGQGRVRPGRAVDDRRGRGVRGGSWEGYGPGRGGGRRRGPWRTHAGWPPAAQWERTPYAPPTREQEIEMLREEAEWLTSQLDNISQHMEKSEQE
jgi:hypothetical protein